ncbi:hypothetical protein GEV33_005993 [Tenebrio molitor]|uniref:Uncharacterized protein n=1 Tax=Tenebrio molitor TaxID=7067 RepID=A0A8J6HNI1_TENMO|nr:hypothetical protein GEV33_005993 [Tenebrio molitor]
MTSWSDNETETTATKRDWEYEYFKYISISPGRTGLPLRTGSGPRGGVPRARAHLSERRRPRPNFEKCDGRRDAYEARNGNPSGTKFNVKPSLSLFHPFGVHPSPRATLAEKEVTTLKEQIANNTTNNCENKEGSNMDRQTFENEIAAKDKEDHNSYLCIKGKNCIFFGRV